MRSWGQAMRGWGTHSSAIWGTGLLDQRLFALQSQAPSKGDAATVNKLRLQIVQLEDVVSHMADTQASLVSSGTGAPLHLTCLP